MSKNTIKVDWTDRVIDLTKQMYRELCQKSESHLRDELIKMGWTPPKLTGTAGECTCTKPGPFSRHPDCPLHGWEADLKKGQKEYQRFNPTPDLPLHVRVAKDLRKIADALEKGETNEGN
jgi:hypothetical protein